MKAALIVFDRMTFLDFVGFYDPLTRLRSMGLKEDLEWRICSDRERVADDRGPGGLTLRPDEVGGSLAGYDLLFVPGGVGTRALRKDPGFIAWLLTATPVPLKLSVCTGALLLGAAGFLRGRPATTHPSALGELVESGASVREARLVDDGDLVTAGGVTAAIDLGLHVVARLAGPEARARVARQMCVA